MARITNAILGQKGFARNSQQAMVDLTYGGQHGYAPNLVEWVNNQAYIRHNLMCILLEAPRFFQLMPESDKWVQTLKSLVELHARTIEGFNGHLKVDTDEHPVGGAGEMQEEPVNVTRERSTPEFTFVEKYGNPIQTFLYNWITYGIMDPDTKFALAGTLTGERPDDMLADWYSMTCLFIEPDKSQRKVVKSWVTTNMFPKATGEIIGKRDLTAASELTTLTVEFSGISQFNLGTNVFAQNILDSINYANANPYLRPSFVQGVSSDVLASTEGHREGIDTLSTRALAPNV